MFLPHKSGCVAVEPSNDPGTFELSAFGGRAQADQKAEKLLHLHRLDKVCHEISRGLPNFRKEVLNLYVSLERYSYWISIFTAEPA